MKESGRRQERDGLARRRRRTENDSTKALTAASLSVMTPHRSLVLVDLVVFLRRRRSVGSLTAVPPIRLTIRHGAHLSSAQSGRQSIFHATGLKHRVSSARNPQEMFLQSEQERSVRGRLPERRGKTKRPIRRHSSWTRIALSTYRRESSRSGTSVYGQPLASLRERRR